MYKALTKLSAIARRAGIKIRQSYTRVAKKACVKVSRYIHAKQMRRAKRELKFMRHLTKDRFSILPSPPHTYLSLNASANNILKNRNFNS